jgi:hypothetical protein
MSEPRTEFETALEVARKGRAAWEEEPTKANFIIWRDASEVAIKWHRAIRLGSDDSSSDEENPFAEFDELAARRAS